MTDRPIDERRFSDEEVREILAKAVEQSPSRGVARTDGLSLTELKAIGAEVGIEPARVEDAARSVALRRSDRRGAWLGGPTTLAFERRVPGTLSATDIPDVVALIRRIMGQQGEVSEVHGAVEWSSKGESGERLVTISSRDDVTTIGSSANLTQAAILTYLPAGIVASIVSLIGLLRFAQAGEPMGLVVFVVVLPILYPILRTIYRRFSGSEADKLRRVVDELAERAEGTEEIET